MAVIVPLLLMMAIENEGRKGGERRNRSKRKEAARARRNGNRPSAVNILKVEEEGKQEGKRRGNFYVWWSKQKSCVPMYNASSSFAQLRGSTLAAAAPKAKGTIWPVTGTVVVPRRQTG
jgi:hypothetical protein